MGEYLAVERRLSDGEVAQLASHLARIFELKLTDRFEHLFVEMHDLKMVHLSNDSDLIRKYVSENNLDNIHLDWH